MRLRRALLIVSGTALVAVLLVAVGARSGNAAFPGVNGRIAYVCDPDVPEICVINADGSGLGYLTQTDDNASFDESSPAWSPDGRRIAFVVVGSCMNAIYVMNADRTGLHRVLVERAAKSGLWSIHDVSWSPDGNRLVYSKSFLPGPCPFNLPPENYLIFTINVSGSGERRISNVSGLEERDNQPAWSPDGSSIAFYHGPALNSGLYVMTPDGNSRRRLDSSLSGYPNWSPDGTRIAYECNRTAGTSICVYSLGGGITQLGVGTMPAWSPDGTHIVFKLAGSQADPDGGIYVMAANGTQRREIVARGGVGETRGNPDWQPCRGTCPPAPGLPSYKKRRKPLPSLSGKVGPDFTIAIRNQAGHRVKKLVEGTYLARVNDRSRRHSFHIRRQGGKFNFRTSVRGIGRGPQLPWQLIPGSYRYFCDAHPGRMRGKFSVVVDPLGGYRP